MVVKMSLLPKQASRCESIHMPAPPGQTSPDKPMRPSHTKSSAPPPAASVLSPGPGESPSSGPLRVLPQLVIVLWIS